MGYLKRYEKSERVHFDYGQRTTLLLKTNFRCAHCGKPISVDTMTVDHIFPIYRGGKNDEYNLLPLCYECNQEKGHYVYEFEDYYKYIVDKNEKEIYSRYYAFASFEWNQMNIIDSDDTKIYYIPDKCLDILARMPAKKANKLAYNMQQSAVIRKAYQDDAEGIYALMSKTTANKNYTVDETIYKSIKDIENVIRKGVVYVMGSPSNIKFVCIFERIKNVIPNGWIDFVQFNNIVEQTGLHPKYIMTFATCFDMSHSLFSKTMEYLRKNMISKCFMPLYFNILSNMYVDSDKCIKIPYKIKGLNGFLEFMPISELEKAEEGVVLSIFDYFGYDINDSFEFEEDVHTLTRFLMNKQYQADFNKEEMKFFDKYPKILDIFKPESYEYFDVGFVHDYYANL